MKVTVVGSGGGRIAVFLPKRRGSGFLVEEEDFSLLVDPGPGVCSSLPFLVEPRKVNYIYLSHSHLDHSSDLNCAIEMVTLGGRVKDLHLICPEETVKNRVLLPYLKSYLSRLTLVNEEITIETPHFKLETVENDHNFPTYGFNLFSGKTSLSYVADTIYNEKVLRKYRCENVIANVLLVEPQEGIPHLSHRDMLQRFPFPRARTLILTHTSLKAETLGVDEFSEFENLELVVKAEDFDAVVI